MTSRNPEDIEQDIERTRSEMKDTIEAIEQKLAPQRLLEQAMGAVREVVGADSGIGRTVRNNPVPLALMGIGAVWLFIAASRKSGSSTAYDDDTRYGYQMSEGYGYEGGLIASQGSGGLASGDDAAGEGYGGPRYGDGEAGRAGRVLGRAKSKASRYADDASRYAHTMQDRAGEWARDARSQVDHLTSRAGDIYTQYPIAIGIGAVMVGAIIGASIGRTRTENDLMGRHRDDLLRQADQSAAEALRKGEALAAKAVEGAREAASEASENVAGSAGSTGRVMH